MTCEPLFLGVQLFLCGTHGIYFYLHTTIFSSTEQCAWAIISPKEFKSWVTRISFALLYGKTELSAVKTMVHTSCTCMMKQTDSSIIIVRNVCVLTSSSMIVYLFVTHIICITVRENRIICCQIFCDLLLKSAFERIFNVMQLILVKIKWRIKWKYLIQKFMKQTDSSIIIVRNVCVLTSASMIVYLFFTRSWSAIIGTKQPKVSTTMAMSINMPKLLPLCYIM
jgi:hypothetical protein